MDTSEETQERQKLRHQYRSYLKIVWKKPDNCPICDSTYWNLGDLIDAPLRGILGTKPDLFSTAPRWREAYVYVPVTCLYLLRTSSPHEPWRCSQLRESASSLTPSTWSSTAAASRTWICDHLMRPTSSRGALASQSQWWSRSLVSSSEPITHRHGSLSSFSLCSSHQRCWRSSSGGSTTPPKARSRRRALSSLKSFERL
jgi:hypothetical protein